MQAVVLAGGYGTRLWPITEHRPKMLLPVGDKTVLDSILEPIERDDRVDQAHICTNDRFNEPLETFVQSSEFSKARLSVEPTKREAEKPGAVRALANFVNRENIADDLLVIAGDHYVDFDLSAFLSFFERRRAPSITAKDVGSKEKASSYGVIELEEGEVTGFVEKPDEPESTLTSPACYAFPADALPLFEEYLAADTDPDAPGWFVKWLKDRTTVYAHTIDGHVVDVGTRANYLDAVSWVLDGEALVSDEASIQGTTLGENVIVQGGAILRDSVLEESVVFTGARIVDSRVKASVVDEAAELTRVTLNEELVGEGEQLGTT